MAIYYIEPRKGIRINWNTTPMFQCDKCSERKESGSWATSYYSKKQISKYEYEFIERRIKLGKGRVVNHLKEGCNGKWRFHGWYIWVEDFSKEKIVGDLFRTGSKKLESCWAETIKERKKLINNLCEKYKK